MYNLVVEPTPLKNISQIGSFPQIGVKIKKSLKPPPRDVSVYMHFFRGLHVCVGEKPRSNAPKQSRAEENLTISPIPKLHMST